MNIYGPLKVVLVMVSGLGVCAKDCFFPEFSSLCSNRTAALIFSAVVPTVLCGVALYKQRESNALLIDQLQALNAKLKEESGLRKLQSRALVSDAKKKHRANLEQQLADQKIKYNKLLLADDVEKQAEIESLKSDLVSAWRYKRDETVDRLLGDLMALKNELLDQDELVRKLADRVRAAEAKHDVFIAPYKAKIVELENSIKHLSKAQERSVATKEAQP